MVNHYPPILFLLVGALLWGHAFFQQRWRDYAGRKIQLPAITILLLGNPLGKNEYYLVELLTQVIGLIWVIAGLLVFAFPQWAILIAGALIMITVIIIVIRTKIWGKEYQKHVDKNLAKK